MIFGGKNRNIALMLFVDFRFRKQRVAGVVFDGKWKIPGSEIEDRTG